MTTVGYAVETGTRLQLCWWTGWSDWVMIWRSNVLYSMLTILYGKEAVKSSSEYDFLSMHGTNKVTGEVRIRLTWHIMAAIQRVCIRGERISTRITSFTHQDWSTDDCTSQSRNDNFKRSNVYTHIIVICYNSIERTLKINICAFWLPTQISTRWKS